MSKHANRVGLIAVLAASLASVAPAAAGAQDNWPHWRGPHGNGTSDASGLPVTWSETENIVWKVALPSWSGGTPVIWGDRIFVTSPSPEDSRAGSQQGEKSPRTERGRGRGRGFGGRGYGGGALNPGGPKLLLICLSTKDGAPLWQREIDDGNRLWRKQNSSSPSPVTDGKHVCVVTGNGTVSVLDFRGQLLWTTNLQEQFGQFGLKWGYASSPILVEGKLIIEVLHGDTTDEPSYLVAYDVESGKQLWRHERLTDALGESPDAYTTPLILRHNNQTQVVVSGGDYVTAHRPDTGEEIWRAAGLNPNRDRNFRIVGSPVAAAGMIYAPTRKIPLLALRAGGSGDVSTSHLAWRFEQLAAAPDVPTPACDGEFLYLVNDQGMVTCLDAKTGRGLWGPERTALGTVSASPLVADGKIYVTNESGETTVLAAGGEFQILATNKLEAGYTLSSLAVSGSRLLLRGATHLYCIGE